MVDLKPILIFTIIPFLLCEVPPSFLRKSHKGGLPLLFFNRTEEAVGRAKGFSSLSEEYSSTFNKNGHRALGIPALKGEVPFQVLLKLDGSFNCGGTLISNKFVLTAAHCVHVHNAEARSIIVIGELNQFEYDFTEVEMKAKRVIFPPDYIHYEIGDDIALLELEKPVRVKGYIQIASLPKSETTSGNVTAAGWGLTTGNVESDRLLIAHLEIVPRSQCKETFRRISIQEICAISKRELHGVCSGDSGGGLIKKDLAGNHIVIGVASYVWKIFDGGYPCDLTKPQVFTNVMSYVPWIKKHLNRFS